ncbi:MAG: uroporphyrinogen decarboxylase [Saprospiraceae bacterium]|nr:uroporphyrinogen decarboxylase [Saprospiraceae bacterium]
MQKEIVEQPQTKLKNDLILKVARGEAVDRPPVWLMRQAGRILPQYRALRGKLSGFKELVETPHLAAEVTIQPIDELDVDAAIIFSDILVIPEAMGLTYEMIEKKGPFFPETIKQSADVEKLISGEVAATRLQYVFDALEITKRELSGRVPLIGFAGAPWTILSYMVEGQGSKTFSKARKLLYQNPKLAHQLLQKITDTTIAYLKLKVAAGADMLQVFDSWAGILPKAQYSTFAIPYIRQICDAIQDVPITVFAKDAWFALEELGQLDCNTIGLDWHLDPQDVRRKIGADKALQGNLDPCLLYADEKEIVQTTEQMIRSFQKQHIVNLGHGVYPDTPLPGVKTFVNTVKAFRS